MKPVPTIFRLSPGLRASLMERICTPREHEREREREPATERELATDTASLPVGSERERESNLVWSSGIGEMNQWEGIAQPHEVGIANKHAITEL